MRLRALLFRFRLWGSLFLLTNCFDFGRGQNIVELSSTQFTANPVTLTEKDFSEFFYFTPDLARAPQGAESRRIIARLQAHVSEFVDGYPWMPFHHTLGISGYEASFDHPDEMFYALALAMPFLSKGTAEKLKRFLAEQMQHSPPFAEEGFEQRIGKPRESYDVPANLRAAGRGRADCAFGVYAFWLYCHVASDSVAVKSHWRTIKVRMKPLLEADYKFDINKTDYTNDQAEKLNGDLAALVGLLRLARLNEDTATEKEAMLRGRQLLELRVNLERVNPRILEKTHSATKHLHNFKLARYGHLVPEIGEALRARSDGCGAARLKIFREERNAWHLAFGDRFVGGENYTNPLNLPHALFAGAVFVEQLPDEQLFSFIDVPWCKGDFYFIEKCAYALWASAGRPWKKLP